ncbi:MAG: prolyl 4-hydroxylase [Sphingomonadales bacterium]|jgi:prolyl 4-hydroxylase|nr:prolyl 4-hydroxylase [Sphingomonadales bacterium]
MDANALFAQAAACLRANRVAEARDLFGRAGEAGSREGAVIYCNLTASRVDWEEGLRLLRGLARISPRCRRELEIVEAMAPGPPPPGEIVSEAPHLTLFRGLFTPAECRYLIAAATPMLEASVVVDPATGRQRPDPVRISDGVGFTLPLENPAVHALGRRIAAASGTDVAQGEPLQVLRYRPGGEYKPHFDAIPGFANQRILTMLVWLNGDYEGGETMFMKTGAKLKGGTGDALLFRNALPDGTRDPDAGHAGLPVTRGEKLIASRWIRARPFEMPVDGLAR